MCRLPTIDDILHKLAGATVFSSLDASSGYWQLPLSEESSLLTTFITPFGRYRFTRVPFGISSASEIFQRVVSTLLDIQSLDGVAVYQDDIIISGIDVKEHDERLQQVLNIIEKSGLKLNSTKCRIRRQGLEFLGHWIDRNGSSPHPSKIEAIVQMKPPSDVSGLRRFLGMVNFLGRYVKDMSTYTSPLNELLRKENIWTWGPTQEQSFNDVKRIISTKPVLAFYDVKKPTTVCTDASGYGVGAMLMQQHDNEWKPVAFASRSLSKAEKGYAAIEKECLACTWGCEKFSRYLVGLDSFNLWTDHKPLIPLINSRDIDQTPLRCQRLLLRLMRFNAIASHVPGKDQVVADTLSRQPLEVSDTPDTEDIVKTYIDSIMATVPILDPMIENIKDSTELDLNLMKAMNYTQSSWPRLSHDLGDELRDLYHVRDELTVIDGMLVRGHRIVVPTSMRSEVLVKLHIGHQGVTKCRELASLSVWWQRYHQTSIAG